jgi:hypothetical protein
MEIMDVNERKDWKDWMVQMYFLRQVTGRIKNDIMNVMRRSEKTCLS